MKKISVNTIKAFLKEHETDGKITTCFSVQDSTFEVEIRTQMSIAEKSVFIRRVLSGCFDSTNNYRPEYIDPMIHATILQMCTNVPVLTLKGERGYEGEMLMDVDGMDALYHAMDLNNLGSAEFSKLRDELIALCAHAVEWHKSQILGSGLKMESDTMLALGDAAVAIRDIAQDFGEKSNSTEMSELLEYAGKLSKVSEGLDEGGILKGLIAMRKDQQLE